MIDHKINEAIEHYKTYNNEAFMNGNNQDKNNDIFFRSIQAKYRPLTN